MKILYVINRTDYCRVCTKTYRRNCLENAIDFNRAARLRVAVSPRERESHFVLIDLHWLPVKPRIVFKICIDIAYTALNSGKFS